MLYYSYAQTFSLILLYCWYSYCVSFCAHLDGVCLPGNKRITYLLLLNVYVLHKILRNDGFTVQLIAYISSTARVSSVARNWYA